MEILYPRHQNQSLHRYWWKCCTPDTKAKASTDTGGNAAPQTPKPKPPQILVEMLHPRHQSQSLLLNLSMVALTGYECPGAIGCSNPSGKMCEITAPRPYAEASAAW